MESIIKYGLLPRKKVIEQKINFGDIANPEIISKRTELGLDAYTPFHFHPYSAFDVAVKHTYQEQDMIYLCFDRELARMNHFKILPLHPLSAEECVLYDYDEGFNLIDWEIMTKVGLTDDHAKRIKMAECLSDRVIPVRAFKCFYVSSELVKIYVESVLHKCGVNFPPPFVNIMPQWFA